MVSFSALNSKIQPCSSTIFRHVLQKKGRNMIQIYKVPRWIGPGRRAGPGGMGPLARGPGPARLPGPTHRPTNKNLRSVSSCFLKNDSPPENHEKTTFRAFLETKGPRDPPWVQERQILFRIALTRALYDQMAPQLCLFYVPGQPSKKQFVKKHGLVVKKTPSG